MSRLTTRAQFGQSVWIDWLWRDLLQSGGLQRLIAAHGVTGVTTNPTILERAITAGGAYDRQIHDLHGRGVQPAESFIEIAATDIGDAAIRLLPVWHASRGADGYVSWEVDPALAWKASATLAHVDRLRRRIDLPNLLVKIPATEPGLRAIENALAAGYSVNVTTRHRAGWR